MSVTFGISLVGHAELLRKLANLEARVSGDVARKTLGVGCTPVLQEMRKTVPIGKTRNLRNWLGKKIKQYRGGVTIGVVGPRLPKGAYAHLTESGTVGHKNSGQAVLPGPRWCFSVPRRRRSSDVATDARGVLDHLVNGKADAAVVFGPDAIREANRDRVVAAASGKLDRPVTYSMAIERFCPNRSLCEEFLS